MPWPMVHFAIAERIAYPSASSSLLLGSISPDAIHARDHVTRSEKGVTHLMSEGNFPSMDTLKDHCITYFNQNEDREWQQFVLGYIAHIYTDIRWTQTLYADFEKKFGGDPDSIRDVYNREVSQIEFNLLRSEVGAEQAIHRLQQAPPFAMAPLVTQREVSQYRDMKLAWLKDDRHEPGIENVYFKDEEVMLFIHRTAAELHGLFHQWGIGILNNYKNTYREIVYCSANNDSRSFKGVPKPMTWYEEEMTFDTMREAQEWVSSDAYNHIGYDYGGYRTTDPKLAYALLYELVKANTKGFGTRKAFADEILIDGKHYYRVWVEWSE